VIQEFRDSLAALKLAPDLPARGRNPLFVEVCLNRAVDDPDAGSNFQAGRQRISGGDALSFVRQRQELPNGDLDRIVRQQVFMAAVANRGVIHRCSHQPESH
jgi:hypothetical protein